VREIDFEKSRRCYFTDSTAIEVVNVYPVGCSVGRLPVGRSAERLLAIGWSRRRGGETVRCKEIKKKVLETILILKKFFYHLYSNPLSEEFFRARAKTRSWTLRYSDAGTSVSNSVGN
jgi:hypothetical protein